MTELLELSGERGNVRALFNDAAVENALDKREYLRFEGAQTPIDTARTDGSKRGGTSR